MRKIIFVTIASLLFGALVFAQDLTNDRDYQNFKRNYARAIKGFAEHKNSSNPRKVRNLRRFTKYARKFLTPLIGKYGLSKFASENEKISEIERALSLSASKEITSAEELSYLRLWIHRLSPPALNSANAITNLQSFDESRLRRIYDNFKRRGGLDKRFTDVDLKNFESALNDFENYLLHIKVFDPYKGSIGSHMERSKQVQEKSYFVQLLTLSKNSTVALLRVSPRSPSLNSKLQEINRLIANADTEIARNKPKLIKKYKESLPKAIVKNRNLERQFAEAIRAQKFPGVNITGAIITSPNWILHKSATGRTLYRWREAHVIAKTAEGDCWFQNFSFKQAYTGSGFRRAVRSASGSRYYIKCSKLR